MVSLVDEGVRACGPSPGSGLLVTAGGLLLFGAHPDLLSMSDFPSLLDACAGPVARPVGLSGPSIAGPAPRGLFWVLKHNPDPRLGFPATLVDLRHSRVPPRSLVLIPPPHPLLLSFAAVVAMDHSRGLSCDCTNNGKRPQEESSDVGLDPMAYEASLWAKLQAEQAARERATADQDAWSFLPPWCQEEGCRKEEAALAQI